MKKLFALVVMTVSIAAVYTGGIYEYKGHNYLAGPFAAGVAMEYVSQNDIKEFGVDSAIYDNKLCYSKVWFNTPRACRGC